MGFTDLMDFNGFDKQKYLLRIFWIWCQQVPLGSGSSGGAASGGFGGAAAAQWTVR